MSNIEREVELIVIKIDKIKPKDKAVHSKAP